VSWKIPHNNSERSSRMKRAIWLVIGAILILFSVEMGRLLLHLFFTEVNLSSEFDIMLKGSIASFRWLGILFFGFGAIKARSEERKQHCEDK
jgi:hypothetical protein